MANNFTEVGSQIVAKGLKTFRNNSFLPVITNRGYDVIAGNRGEQITIPHVGDMVVKDVSPSHQPLAGGDTVAGSIQVPLDRWKYTSFFMDDKQHFEINGQIPSLQIDQASKSLINHINEDIFEEYKNVWQYVGDPTTNVFAKDDQLTNIASAGFLLDLANTPTSDRQLLLNTVHRAEALTVPAIQNYSYFGSPMAIQQGVINSLFGFQCYSDNLKGFIHNTGANLTGIAVNNSSGVIKGSTTMVVDGVTSSPVKGDLFSIAGSKQSYVVESYDSNVLNFQPALVTAAANDSALTFVASHSVSLAFHKSAIVFATRPLKTAYMSEAKVASMTDPLSNVALRVEILRQSMQEVMQFDVLYGVKVIRPSSIVRIIGKPNVNLSK